MLKLGGGGGGGGNSNSRVVKKKCSERNKKPYPPLQGRSLIGQHMKCNECYIAKPANI